MRRIERVNEVMNQVPAIPDNIKEWINQKAINGEDYALKDKESGKHGKTARFVDAMLLTDSKTNGKRIENQC